MHNPRVSVEGFGTTYTKLCVSVCPIDGGPNTSPVPMRIFVHETERGIYPVEFDGDTPDGMRPVEDHSVLTRMYYEYIVKGNKFKTGNQGRRGENSDYETAYVTYSVSLSAHDARGNVLQQHRFTRRVHFPVREIMRRAG